MSEKRFTKKMSYNDRLFAVVEKICPPGLNQFKPSEVPGVVYSIHMYLPHAFTHQGVFSPDAPEYSYPGEIEGVMWDKAQLEAALKPAMDFQKTYNVHIYIYLVELNILLNIFELCKNNKLLSLWIKNL